MKEQKQEPKNVSLVIILLPIIILILFFIFEGIFSPYTPIFLDAGTCSMISSCTTGSGFNCRDANATQNQMQMRLVSNLGQDLDLVKVDFSGDVTSCKTLTLSDQGGNPAQWTQGSDCSINCSAHYDKGSTVIRNGKNLATFAFSDCKFSGIALADFVITYEVAGENISHEITGRANLKAEK